MAGAVAHVLHPNFCVGVFVDGIQDAVAVYVNERTGRHGKPFGCPPEHSIVAVAARAFVVRTAVARILKRDSHCNSEVAAVWRLMRQLIRGG
jgi:hypothetical protein